MPATTKPTPPTVLVLDDFDEGVQRLTYSVVAEELGLAEDELRFAGPIEADITIGRAMQMFTISGTVQGTVEGECSRCLKPARGSFASEFRFLLQRKDANDEEVEALEDDEDVDIVDPGRKEVDLVDRLHDAVLLELPLRLYCKDDCKGLCARCGQDFNEGTCSCGDDDVDPRWEALAKLKTT